MSLVEIDQDELTQNLHKASQRLRDVDGIETTIRASSIYDCMRKRAYQILKIPKTNIVFNPNWDLSAKIGDAIHLELQMQLVISGQAVLYPEYRLPKKLQRYLDELVITADTSQGSFALELPLEFCCDPLLRSDLISHNISGHIDALIRDGNGDLCVLDIKTIDPKYLLSGGKSTLEDKKRKWESQVSTYMHYVSMPDGEIATRGLILVISRGNTKDRVLYEIDYDENLVQTELTRAYNATQLISQNILPDPEIKRGPCFFCEWRNRCMTERSIASIQEDI